MDMDVDADIGPPDADTDLDGGMDFDIDFDGGMDMDVDADIGPPDADTDFDGGMDFDIDFDGGMDMDMDADIGPPDVDIDVDGGMDFDGGPPSDGGHVVLIGHDYYENESTADQILANAVALGDSGGTIQVAAYTEDADMSGEYANMVTALDTYLGIPYTVTDIGDEAGLDLSAYDVFMIPEQEYSSLSGLTVVGDAMASELEAFVADGGVVIAADFNGSSGGTWATIASLFDSPPTGTSNVTGQTLTIPDPSHPLVEGIDVSTYTALDGSLSFSGPPSGTAVATAPSGEPVVIHIGAAGGGDPGDFDIGPPDIDVDADGGDPVGSGDYVMFTTDAVITSSTSLDTREDADAYCEGYAASEGIDGIDFRIVYSTPTEDARDYVGYVPGPATRVYDRDGALIDEGDLWDDDTVVLPDLVSWTITGSQKDGSFYECSGSPEPGGWPICQYCSKKYTCAASGYDPFNASTSGCCWTGERAIICMGEIP